jgi:hypothetical protein
MIRLRTKQQESNASERAFIAAPLKSRDVVLEARPLAETTVSGSSERLSGYRSR